MRKGLGLMLILLFLVTTACAHIDVYSAEGYGPMILTPETVPYPVRLNTWRKIGRYALRL
jgi:hypothetical protein